jgi:hypothetical protein
MKDERIKEIMDNLGMLNSISLYVALRQVVNEVEQETIKECIGKVDHIQIENGRTCGDLLRWYK